MAWRYHVDLPGATGQGWKGGPHPAAAVSFTGEVFYSTSPEKFTFQEAANECRRLGARLATTGQLYLAWQGGMDMCSAGWLADRSVRYPISKARPNCGGNLLGVRTVYLHANQTGYPDPSSRYDAICYTGAAGGQEGGSCQQKQDPEEEIWEGGGVGFDPFLSRGHWAPEPRGLAAPISTSSWDSGGTVAGGCRVSGLSREPRMG